MDEIEIPEHFLCPISMQLMKDPVILSTGITYDRDSIEKWLYSSSSCKNITCPVTKQELSGTDLLTPNHTLRRLIQSWCIIHSGNGIERIPTPCSPVTKTQILKLFQESNKSTKIQLKCVNTLKSIVQGYRSNRKCFVDAGGVQFLASIMNKNGDELEKDPDFNKTREQALDILCNLELSDNDLKKLTEGYDGRLLEYLIKILQCGDFESRSYAIRQIQCVYSALAGHLRLMNTCIEFAPDLTQLVGVNPEIFIQTIQILRDQVSQQATKAALKLLLELCKWGSNRINAAKVGAVPVLIEILLDTSAKRVSELIMAALDQLCRCAEGRAELLEHGAGLAVVSKKILRISPLASEKAVRIISSIAKCSSNSRVLQEMIHVGVVAKLCLVLQVERNHKIVERTKEILVLHSGVWKDSPCIPHLPSFLK